jgi:hypothetical protein
MIRRGHLVTGLSISAVTVLALGSATACSDDAKSPADPGTAAEAGADAPPAGSNQATQKGRIVDAIDKFGVAGATVSAAGKSVTTNEDGTYAIVVPKNTPYSMSITSPAHFKLNEQEWIVKNDLFDRTDTSMLPNDIATLLASFLPPRDPTKGLLVVRIYPLPPCDSEQGSTLAIEPKGISKVTYFANGRPSKDATSTTKDEAFSAAISDVDPGAPVKVTVTSPLCEEIPFPVDYQDVTYTGVQKTEPGDVLSYLRVFIGPKKVVDAGTD